MGIAENIAKIRERVERAALRAGRDPKTVALMAVCKTQPVEAIREAFAAGQRLFGENRVQEFAEKASRVGDLRGAEFHMIGHLQSNKARTATELFAAVDSVDSLKLAERLNAAAEAIGKTLDILIEVNVGGEEAKSGLALGSPEIAEIVEQRWTNLRVRGLMTVPPFTENPEGARGYFRKLRELRDRYRLEQLSMGMSQDFEVAIEEGSTCVRVGTAIFGERVRR